MAIPVLDDHNTSSNLNEQQPRYRAAFSLLVSLFFMWGFITVVNDPLISAFKKMFNLEAFHASLVQSAFFGAFFVVSLIYFLWSTATDKDPINIIGYKNGMALSLGVCSIGCFTFWPAAQAASYPLFLGALFILASGITLLQICANPYAAIMGSPATASSRLNMAQGFNSLGTTVGPLVATLLIFKIFSGGAEATPKAIGYTYAIAGGVFLLMAIVVKLAAMPEYNNTIEAATTTKSIKDYPQLLLGIGAIFFYVGGEVAVGSWLMPLMEDVYKMTGTEAGSYLAFYWGGAMIGRLCGAISLQHELPEGKKYSSMIAVSLLVFALIYTITGVDFEQGAFVYQSLDLSAVKWYLLFMVINFGAFYLGKSQAARTLSIFSVVVILLLLVGVWGGQSELALWALLSVGLFNSIMWSNIFTLAIEGLGNLTSKGSSLLIMAIVGGAFIPAIQGLMIDKVGIQTSFLVPIVCYVYILFFGIKAQTKVVV